MKIKKIVLLALMALISTLSYSQSTTRYWIGGGTAHFTDGAKWSLTSGGPPIGGTITWKDNDIARFDANSGSPTVNYTSSTDVGKLQISGNITVTIKNTHSLSRTFTVKESASDALTVATSSTLIISGESKNTTVQMYNNYEVTANISGTVKVVTGAGGGIGKFEKGSGATINFNSGSSYQHDVNSDALPEATWHATSTCAITGITSSGPSKMDQSFGHFIWNCPGQTSEISINDSFTVKGNFTVTSTGSSELRISSSISRTLEIFGNFAQNSGVFVLSSSGASSTMSVTGSFVINGGDFYISKGGGTSNLNIDGNFSLNNSRTVYMSTGTGYTNLNIRGHFDITGNVTQNSSYSGRANIYFNGTSTQIFTRHSGIIYYGINFTVMSTSTFDMGTSVLGNHLYSSGNFVLESGATLRTAHSQGITTSGASGCIQVYGTRTYAAGASYQFYRSGSQPTGNGFPAVLNGVLTVGSLTNATNLSLTNGSVTINNKLVLVSSGSANSSIASGTVAYGSNGILEYQGASAQTTTNAEFPSSSGPRTAIINNSHEVSLHASRTIPTALNLQQGQFSIGSNTLTLHGAVNQTSGTWVGGPNSNLVMGGTGASTNLPAIELNDLTINRPNGIGLAGNITVHGTVYMTAGSLTSNGFFISYGENGTLHYNAATLQTCGVAEFPENNGPKNLTVQNPGGVLLHASRTISGVLSLSSGTFAIGSNTLTINGIINRTAGNLSGGSASDIVFGENETPAQLPPVVLNNLTVNRSSGIAMAGPATVNNLILSNGEFSIGSNHLTINGGITKTSGTLAGGDFSSVTFGGSGTPTGLHEITLQTLTINRPQGVILTGNLTIKNQLQLMSGALQIGSNTIFMDGGFQQITGALAGGVNSNIAIRPGMLAFNTVHLPGVELGILSVNRTAGVILNGDLSVHQNIELETGNLFIGSYTLTMNGELAETGGSLQANENSSLVIGGSGTTVNIGIGTLKSLQLNRATGIQLFNNLLIYNQLVLIDGNINLNGFELSYQPGAMLRYAGNAARICSNAEFPETNGPTSLEIINPAGIELHESRTIQGNLMILAGNFQIAANMLTLNGNLFSGFSDFSGKLIGGEQSDLSIGGNANRVNLNGIVLNNLFVNRPMGILMTGDLDLFGALTLENGQLNLMSNQLTLRNPVLGNPELLFLLPESSLEIAGEAEGMNIGSQENIRIIDIKNLTISNTHETGIMLNGDLQIWSNLNVEPNALFIVGENRNLTVHGMSMLK